MCEYIQAFFIDQEFHHSNTARGKKIAATFVNWSLVRKVANLFSCIIRALDDQTNEKMSNLIRISTIIALIIVVGSFIKFSSYWLFDDLPLIRFCTDSDDNQKVISEINASWGHNTRFRIKSGSVACGSLGSAVETDFKITKVSVKVLFVIKKLP